jgi:N-acetylneuraminate synthase
MKKIRLNNKIIARDSPCYIIAEAGVNHDGSLEKAIQLVDAAADAGADAVKFQSFSAERLVMESAPKAEYQKAGAGADESQLKMLRKLELSQADQASIAQHTRKRGIEFLSTPFDESWADFLDTLGVCAFKIGSGELTNLRLLAHVAKKGKPVILSTGMASIEEIEEAVAVITATGLKELILLQCTSAYPAAPETINLKAMATLRRHFGVWTGFSDHTTGIEVAIAAVAVGASVLEKHFTLDRKLPGPDHRMSIEPAKLTAMIRAIRNVEKAMGDGKKARSANEQETAVVARRSLVAARDMCAGEMFDSDAIAVQRPGTGITASKLNQVLGRKAQKDIRKGQLLSMEMFEETV